MNRRDWWNILTGGAAMESVVAGLLASEFMAGTSLLMLDEIWPAQAEPHTDAAREAMALSVPDYPGV